METYLRDINETALLSAAQEKQLAVRVQKGDPAARDHMVRANLRLVVNIARGYSNRGLQLCDLIEEGNLGLMRAVEGFDPTVGTRFSTYASYWIKQSITTWRPRWRVVSYCTTHYYRKVWHRNRHVWFYHRA